MRPSPKDLLRPYIPRPILSVYYPLMRWYIRLCERLYYIFSRVRVDRRSGIAAILNECWADYRVDGHPKDRRMAVLAEKSVSGMSTENIRFLINEIVRRYAQNGVYLEVGTYQGGSLLSAALGNPSTRCIGIDNFSQFDPEGKNETFLRRNLAGFGDPANIEFYNEEYRAAFGRLFGGAPAAKVDVYYYDGEHSYRGQIDGLEAALPYLAERCIVLVDDVTWLHVARANRDFLRRHPAFRSAFRVRTQIAGAKAADWHNGFEVLVRGI